MVKWRRAQSQRSRYERKASSFTLTTPENADLFDDFGNGSLHLYFARNPENWRGEDRRDAFYIELDFHACDWDALYIDVLRFPGWDEYAEGNDIDELHERNRRKFELTIPAYAKLARLFDMKTINLHSRNSRCFVRSASA